MSPFRRNWEQHSFNKVEHQDFEELETENWEETLDDGEEDLTLVLDDAQDALSRFMSRESRRGEKREQTSRKQRQAWQ